MKTKRIAAAVIFGLLTFTVLIATAGDNLPVWYARCPECGAVSRQPVWQGIFPCFHCGHHVQWTGPDHPDYAGMRSEYEGRRRGAALHHSYFLLY